MRLHGQERAKSQRTTRHLLLRAAGSGGAAVRSSLARDFGMCGRMSMRRHWHDEYRSCITRNTHLQKNERNWPACHRLRREASMLPRPQQF